MILDVKPTSSVVKDRLTGGIVKDRPSNFTGQAAFEDKLLDNRLRGMPYGLLLALTIPVNEVR